MNLKKVVVSSGFAIVLMAAAQIVLAEEITPTPADPGVITSSQQSTLQKETDMQWAWGEVTNLDNQAKTITLKYLDYETDQEKELVLVVDEKTTFESIQDFNALKLKDTLSIDYVVGMDNKNIAKNISFEKPDVSSPASPVVENGQPIISPSSIVQPVVEAVPPTAQSGTSVDSSVAINPAPASTEPAPAPADPAVAAQGQVQ